MAPDRRSFPPPLFLRVLSLAALGGLAASIAAADDLARSHVVSAADLYRTQAIVTGQNEIDRARGFAIAFQDVLIKVSGDPRLIGDPKVEAMKAQAGTFVADFNYHDRMSGIPVHDEQGTRERPYDLTVTFDHEKVDAALRSLERTPWTAPRPRLAVLLGVQDAQTKYILAEDGDRGRSQRESLAAVAVKRGMPVTLPRTAALTGDKITYDQLAATAPPRLDAVVKQMGDDVALVGTLVWTESALGWTANWELSWHGADHRWQIAGVSFDDAFRRGIEGAAQIVSDHGQP